jgi:alpha-mannosidase
MSRDIACTVEALCEYRNSKASIQVTLYADLPYMDINTRVHWQERRKMVKLILPLNMPDSTVTCEVPYGIAQRAADGTEHSQNRWLRLDEPPPAAPAKTGARKQPKVRRLAIGVANDGQYGFAVTPDGTVGLSIARGAVHTRWGEQMIEPDEHHTFIDQGQIDTRFRVLVDTAESLADSLIPVALELNQPMDAYAAFYPPTPRLEPAKATQAFAQVSPTTVQLGALYKVEGDDAMIARLVESAGQTTEATLSVIGADDYTLTLKPYEIVTLKVKYGGKGISIKPCDLLG